MVLVVMEREKPIDRAIEVLEAQFDLKGLPKLHRDEYEAMAIAVFRCWGSPTDYMVDTAKSIASEVLDVNCHEVIPLFAPNGVENLWNAMLVAGSDEVIERRS